MDHKVFTIGILATLLARWVLGVSTYAQEDYLTESIVPDGSGNESSTDQLYSHIIQEPTSQAPVWQQVNNNGFGSSQTDDVSALASFNGYLYAGTSNPTDGARIFRSQDGVAWNPVTQAGFGEPHDIRAPAILDLTEYNGYLYATTGRGGNPGQIWRSVDGLNWAPMVIHGFSNPDTVDISILTEYDGMLYAGAANLTVGPVIHGNL
jgi:hypothetical protein